MKFLLAALLAVAVLIAIFGATTQNVIPRPVPEVLPGSVSVEIPGQGAVSGNVDTTLWSEQRFMQFLGIPYAESPSRELRFKPPVPRIPWRHIVDGTRYGLRCPVITTVSQLPEETFRNDLEDCLNLCVYTKDLYAKRPVMFYIYGGGFYNGSSSDHPPHHLLEKDIVLVVPHYRIGALGWLSTLSDAMPGNAPVMDLQLALQWVQKYIHVFGGDPTQVTVFGQSAGAVMAGALLLSPQTPDGLFQRMITQSGSILGDWALNKQPRAQVERICQALECAACASDVEQLQCLKAAPVLKLLEVTQQESFSPIVGDVNGILPQHPSVLFGSLKKEIPIMAGFTKHDGSFVLADFYDGVKRVYGNASLLTVRQFANGIIALVNDTSGLQKQMLTRLLLPNALLDTHEHKQALSAYFDLTNISFMKSPVIAFVTQMLSKQFNQSIYLYTFDYEGTNTRFGYEFGNAHYPFNGGVHHSNDNIYLFSTHTLNDNDTEMAKRMVQLWTSFAINGKPNVADGPEILPMKVESGPYFHINSKITIGTDVLQELTATIDDPESKKLDREDIEF